MIKIIRNHLQQLKVEQPEEYAQLMEGYETEDEFINDVLRISSKAINYHEFIKEGNWNK
jgi:hypothetical protein